MKTKPEVKHTPGPLSITNKAGGMVQLWEGLFVKEMPGNVLRAAPELLEILKTLVRHENLPANSHNIPLLEKAHAAIAKAEGK